MTMQKYEFPTLHEVVGMPDQQREHEMDRMRAYIRDQLHPDAARAQKIYDHWTKMRWWTILEATIIAMGLDPNHLAAVEHMGEEDATRFHALHNLVERNFGNDGIDPAEFVRWARSKKIAIDQNLLSEIEKRLQKEPRPVGTSKQEKTEHKMLLAMACGKYRYKAGGKSDHEVANSIANDFLHLQPGGSLSEGAILSALQRACESFPDVLAAIEREKRPAQLRT